MLVHGIAVSGKAGGGKSRFAQALVRGLDGRGQAATVVSFADELKREVKDEWGITKEMPGGREALIRYGEQKRAEDEWYWIKRLVPRLRLAWACGVVPVIDDMRCLPEYEFALGVRFATVRMIASQSFRADRLFERGEDPAFVWADEPTERYLDCHGHDFRIRNFHGFNFDARAAHTLDSLRYEPFVGDEWAAVADAAPGITRD